MTPELRLVAEPSADIAAAVLPLADDQVEQHPAAGFLAATGFTGRLGQVALSPDSLFVGLGGADPDARDWRRVGVAIGRAASRLPSVSIELPTGPDRPAVVQAVAEGILLGSYQYTAYKSRPEPAALARVDLVVENAAPADQAALDGALVAARAVLLARDLGNQPGGDLTPTAFADRAVALAAETGLTCEVWDQDRIAEERLGGLLGVARGSVQPPRLVVLRYQPDGATEDVALVGKGVTFDSGGLSIKTTNLMSWMKADMAGAAAILAAMTALGDLGCRRRVVAWLPLTDNMTGGDATRIGDVLTARNGTTIEVRNADAEGRLILADALALAAEERPDAILDVATLTEAPALAIGRGYAALMGRGDDWLTAVRSAADRAGEKVWPLPLDESERSQLDSKVADLGNVGKRYGQSVAAGLFLREFVGDTIPWAHLDIAGPAFADDDNGESAAGATGYGVRTLLELLAE